MIKMIFIEIFQAKHGKAYAVPHIYRQARHPALIWNVTGFVGV